MNSLAMTDQKSDSIALSTRLCKKCGLCCNGILFEEVRLLPSDVPKELALRGIKIHSKKKEPFFEQPCTAYKNNCCSIYAQRPTRCRLFECQQLKRIASGESTEQEAFRMIAIAYEKIEVLKKLLQLTGPFKPKRSFFKEMKKRRAEPLDENTNKEAFIMRAELEKTFQELQEFLNKEFRNLPGYQPLP